MIRLTGITTAADQEHVLSFLDDPITVRFLYHEPLEFWSMDVTYKGTSVFGVKIAVGVRLLKNNNFPFDVSVNDDSGNGVDPFTISDLSQRMSVYFAEPEEIAEIRGYVVEV